MKKLLVDFRRFSNSPKIWQMEGRTFVTNVNNNILVLVLRNPAVFRK